MPWRIRGIILLCVSACGCGDTATVAQRQSSQSAFDAGVKAFDSGHFSDAEFQFTAAIDAGQLVPDMYCDAFIRRAIARAEIGQTEAALADLDTIARDAPDLDRVHAARARVYLRMGNRDQAASEFQLATKINPRLEKPEGL
jgi:tetratricopeptide (TPR) repeat protein